MVPFDVMGSRARMTVGLVGLLAICAAASCRDATEITVRITTAEKCSDLSAVQIIVGPTPADTQQRFTQHFSAAETRACAPSGTTNVIGTLVVTPGTHAGTIVVAAGVALGGAPAPDAASCADAANAKACIIARRSFTFIDHASLTLPIELDPRCIGNACDPSSTCFQGACVDATVTCGTQSCGLSQEMGNDGGHTDSDGGATPRDAGGAGDSAAVVDGATVDAGEGSAIVDGSSGLQDGDTPIYGYDAASATAPCVGPVSVGHHDSCNFAHGTSSACDGGGGYCCFCVCYTATSKDGTVGCKLPGGMTSTCSAPCSP